ncbi:hypothetical protein DL93DRAFT_2233925 [Clavulina sp. PMI_390]|nr:hypothetical protein DL93DRAFT_2233925 [Clavulina sp. PMI_390]
MAEERFAICIDIGTTTSAVSVFWSRRGAEPLCVHVDRWPGQERNFALEFTSSALIYSDQNELITCGAEAYTPQMKENVEQRGWKLVEHFKMHLHPVTLLHEYDRQVQPLPRGITIDRVYVDFLTFLIGHTRRHIKGYVGIDPWPSMFTRIEILLTHPNRWGNVERKFLQQVVAKAGIIPLKETASRLFFAEEGEAAATCYILRSPIKAPSTLGATLVICDAGGSTIDISAYKVSSGPHNLAIFKEVIVPISLPAGGVQVDVNFAHFLATQLRPLIASQQMSEKDFNISIAEGIKDFQEVAKRKFSLEDDPLCQVKVGGRRMNIPGVPIKRGIYSFKGVDIARSCFDPSIEQIVSAVDPLFRTRSSLPIHLTLTGGLSDSLYIRGELCRRFGDSVSFSHQPNQKPVVVGGLSILVDKSGLCRFQRKESPWYKSISELFSRVFL